MEFATRLCRPGDERVLSVVAQATILETYAGITNGSDLVTYVNAELSPADFSRMLADDRIRLWIADGFRDTSAIVRDEGNRIMGRTNERFHTTRDGHGNLVSSNSSDPGLLLRRKK